MALSHLSRFQGCLLLALGGRFLFEVDGEEKVGALLQPWTDILQGEPYQSPLPLEFWQSLPAPTTEPDFVNLLVILALYHHENPLGFQRDLCQWSKIWQKHFPLSTWSGTDESAICLWQRLLTLILSARFHPIQLPDLLKSPDHWWRDAPPPPFSPDLLNSLTAIANYLETRQPVDGVDFCHGESSWTEIISTAIYLWSKNPTQPRLILKQLQKRQKTAVETNKGKGFNPIIAPLTLALGGAYNGKNVSQQSLGKNHCPGFYHCLSPFIDLLWQRWSGQIPSISPRHPYAPAHPIADLCEIASPLGMQRRSSLKLVSQQDYGQFSSH